MIHVLISTVGGCGVSTMARDFAREAKGLLIEGSNRTRVQDLFIDEAPDAIDDYMDFLRGKPVAEVAISGDGYDLIQGNIFHDLEEIGEADFKRAVENLGDDDVFVDLSRYRDEDILDWAQVADRFYCVLVNRPGSLRAYDRIRFILRKNKCAVPVAVVLNRLKPGDKEAMEAAEGLDLCDALYFYERENPAFSLNGEYAAEKGEKKSFWSFFKGR
ncbi:MAG: hypothetical protein SOW18_03315 [Peptoniphilus sp.]|nr:hypothetical protein [Peptoniphilus sp.]MDY3118546.1 hypothetical protein [Peptoniphilus sp.]